ncbi:MAG: hypothetical protein LBC71_05735 [Oscillospiraceae bacterium]|nr:hypothetical protein [Oscillospiraceae bacterium]
MSKLEIDEYIHNIYRYRHPKLDESEYIRFPSVKSRLKIAINLCSTIDELHKKGYVVGDFNHNNIGVNYSTGQVYFMDCDSFHTTDDDEGKESDLFCLAIFIFKLLMNGVDPFKGVEYEAVDLTTSPFIGNETIERDTYIFKPDKKATAVFCPPEQSLPPEILELFNRAFIDGITNPSERPTATEWYMVLNRFLSDDLTQCDNNLRHQYYHYLDSCPYCEADDRHLAKNSDFYPDINHSTPYNPFSGKSKFDKKASIIGWSIFSAFAAVIVFAIILGVNNWRDRNDSQQPTPPQTLETTPTPNPTPTATPASTPTSTPAPTSTPTHTPTPTPTQTATPTPTPDPTPTPAPTPFTGHRRFVLSDGRIYEGDWVNDRRSGRGVMTHPSGDIYEGEWRNDQYNGWGVYTFADGRIFEGNWVNDVFSGSGVMTWPNGDRYEGEVHNSYAHGHGTFTWSDGEKYTGEFFNGLFHGWGTYTFASGTVKQGRWENGVFQEP